jgi:D-glycero-alpha-D-manno-heptose-7-phosphate kinase
MIVSKTPFRISFFGGGSDLPSYYMQEEGCVISTSIDKYLYISINKKFDETIRLSYSITENVPKTKDLQHDIVRNILELFKIKTGIEITSISDLPSNGTGMGSSSAFAVGLINALYKYLGTTKPNPEALAQRIVDKYKELQARPDKAEYLDFVRKNAKEWYDKVVSYPNITYNIIKALNL